MAEDDPKQALDQAMAQKGQGVEEFMFKMMSSSSSMDEQLAYMIWGSVVTSTKAYESVAININVETQRIFVSVRLRWWARFEKFNVIKDIWLKRAQERAMKFVPSGWRLLLYYERREQSPTRGDHRSKDQTRAGASARAHGDAGNGDRFDEEESEADDE